MSRLIYYSLRIMVPEARLELARCYQRGILNPLCLPIPPLGQTHYINDGNRVINTLIYGGATRSRTEIDGFAIRSIAILPSRHYSSERPTQLKQN